MFDYDYWIQTYYGGIENSKYNLTTFLISDLEDSKISDSDNNDDEDDIETESTGEDTSSSGTTSTKSNDYDYSFPTSNEEYVHGYYRNGKYVEGHYRTKADRTTSNNYSHAGNYTPHNGKRGYSKK